MEATFIQNFSPAVLNEIEDPIDVQIEAYNSIFEFNYVNESGDLMKFNLNVVPLPLNVTADLQLIEWFFYVSKILPNGLFGVVEPSRRLSNIRPFPYIIPTIFNNGSFQENRFDRVIRENVNINIERFTFNHSIINDNYYMFDNGDLIDSNDHLLESLELTINIHTGVLQGFRYKKYLYQINDHWVSVVINIALGLTLATNLEFGNTDLLAILPILIIVTPILIIAILVIYRRLKRS